MKVAILIAGASVAIAACAREGDTSGAVAANAVEATAEAPAATRPALPPLAIDGHGLRLVDKSSGAARPIAFGTAQDAALGALAFRGPPARSTLEGCGAGPLDRARWPDGLTLYFQDGRFIGWALGSMDDGDTPGVTTMSGIGVGSTRAALADAYAIEVMETTLGTEFAAANLFGVLDGPGAEAKVTGLWAGTSCNFR